METSPRVPTAKEAKFADARKCSFESPLSLLPITTSFSVLDVNSSFRPQAPGSERTATDRVWVPIVSPLRRV
ncbi:hypothetical protein SprV_0602230600 [Sparganum proliferum]